MKKETLQKPLIIGLLAFVCCVLWGSAIPCIKTGYGLMGIDAKDTASQILYAGSRFTLAGIMALLLGSLMGRKLLLPTTGILKLAAPLSLVQTVGQYIFFYIGVAHTSGVKGSIITATSTFFAILIATLIFHQEALTLRKIAGCLLGFSGVLLINLMGNEVSGGFHLMGEGFVMIAAIAYATSSVMIKNFSQKENPVALSGYQFFIGGLLMCAVGLIAGGRLSTITSASIGILLYLGLVSAVAYSLWSILLKYNPVSQVTVYGFMNPMCGVVLSAMILGEGAQAFQFTSLIALLLVCAGIYVVNRPAASKNETTKQASTLS